VLSKLSLRSRLALGSAIAVVLSIVICLGYLKCLNVQEAVIQEIRQQELTRSEKTGLLLVRISESHRALTDALAGSVSHKINEEQIYERGRVAIERVRQTSRDFAELRTLFQSDSDLMSVFESIGREMAAYKSAVSALVEICSVDVARAPAEMLKVNLTYVRLVDHMSYMVKLTNSKIGLQLDEILGEADQAKRRMLWLSIASLALLALASSVLYSDLSRTLHEVVHSITRLAHGDLTREVPNQHRRDEVGAIARAVEGSRRGEIERREMLERERTGEDAKMRRAAALSQLVEEFRATVTSALGASAEAIARMDEASSELTTIAENATIRAREVAETSLLMSSSIGVVAGATEELDASLNHVEDQTAFASRSVARVAETTTTATELTGRLAANASLIGDVTGVIRKIAAQINLLSLNATIEAARAGESGRGFAVVAAEVKGLAGQTAAATVEIAARIGGVQTFVSQAVDSVDSIRRTIADVDHATDSISATVQEQARATRAIATSAQQAACAAGTLAEALAEVTEAVQQTNESASSVRGASRAISAQSSGLQTAVNDFLTRVQAA
jgi:methyl-accepting chemotaxis protein